MNFVLFVDVNIQNKSPFAFALGDCVSEDFLLSHKTSPNAWMAIIIIIIVVGEVHVAFHKFAYYSIKLFGKISQFFD